METFTVYDDSNKAYNYGIRYAGSDLTIALDVAREIQKAGRYPKIYIWQGRESVAEINMFGVW